MPGQTTSVDTQHSRDDKRYTEKKNKSERARRKKEDTARLRTLVDLTLNVDPRIKRIKQQEKEAREAKKKARSGGQNGLDAKQKEEEAKKKAEEEAKKKEAEDKVCSIHSTGTLEHIETRFFRLLVRKRKRPKRPPPMRRRRRDVLPVLQNRPVLLCSVRLLHTSRFQALQHSFDYFACFAPCNSSCIESFFKLFEGAPHRTYIGCRRTRTEEHRYHAVQQMSRGLISFQHRPASKTNVVPLVFIALSFKTSDIRLLTSRQQRTYSAVVLFVGCGTYDTPPDSAIISLLLGVF